MKKSNIAMLKASGVESLSKAQMKNVMGGTASECRGIPCVSHADCEAFGPDCFCIIPPGLPAGFCGIWMDVK